MHSLPPGHRAIVDRLQRAPLRKPVELHSALRGFAARLDQPGSHHPFADRELANRIALTCRTLLDDPSNQQPARLRLVQTAVDYLLLAEDLESDVHSILGFDDDALVFDAIVRALGRPDLAVGS